MTSDPVSDHERLEELIRRVQRLERDMDELRKVVRRIESNIHSSSVQRDIRGQGPVLLPRRPTDPIPSGPAVPPPQRWGASARATGRVPCCGRGAGSTAARGRRERPA
jgi:hypothetical protein